MRPEPRRRHAVALRPKARSQRARQRAAVLALAFLGGGAALTVRHMRSQWPSLGALGAGLSARAWTLELAELPEPFLSQARAALAPLSALPPGEAEKSLAQALPWAKSVTLNRRFLSRRAVLSVAPRRPAARLAGGRFLGDDGAVFAAPAALYTEALPQADLGSCPESDRPALARLLADLAAWAGPPAGLERLRCVSAEEGWSASFADRTTVLWGDLRWRAEKLSRLREILGDASPQMSGPVTVDLRYFEDGRALLKATPVARTVAAARPSRRAGAR